LIAIQDSVAPEILEIGSKENLMIKLELKEGNSADICIDSISFKEKSTAIDSDVDAVKLWEDDGNGTFDTKDVEIATEQLDHGIVNFDFNWIEFIINFIIEPSKLVISLRRYLCIRNGPILRFFHDININRRLFFKVPKPSKTQLS
jgi:hypothetical protein